MVEAVSQYWSNLSMTAGNGWNRFWFTPTDQRPLEALRIVFGAIAFYLLATLLPDLAHYFAAGGLLPVETVRELEGEFHSFSYLQWFSSPTELLVVHVIGMVAVALFTLGILTSVTSVLALAAMLATVNRAPMITSQVEPVVTMVLFYLCLGPAGPIAAIVRAITSKPISPVSTWANVTLRLIQVHIALLYATIALSKLMGETWWNGGGVWWLMARPESRLVDFTWLSNWQLGDTPIGRYLIYFWNHAIVAFELLFSILIWNRLLRPLLIAWSVIHWIAIGLLLGQLPLTVAMIAVNLAFVPAEMLQWRRNSTT